MTTQPPPAALLPHQTPAFRIGEREPLVWLISILFTDAFWQRNMLTQSSILAMLGAPNNITQPQPAYKSFDELYIAVTEFVQENSKASECLSEAKKAIAQGELEYYSPPADEWGEKPYH